MDKRNKILVVDDEPTIVELVGNILSLEGFEILRAYNGKQALEILDQHWQEVYLIIVDYMMPEMDGLELVKQVRKNPLYNKIKIIMLTVVDVFDTIKQAAMLKVDDYIIKPFDPQEILDAVARLAAR